MVDVAAAVTIRHTGTATESHPTTDAHPVTPPTDLQGMTETTATDGTPTLIPDHQSTMDVATAHHPEATQGMVALLTAMRTDIPLVALRALNM